MSRSPTMADTISRRPPFSDPEVTADGSPRASVSLKRLETLWVNTGTLCNITCAHCYIESSPRNDRLAYFTLADLDGFLDEIREGELGTELIGFTGGEPFMNPELLPMLERVLGQGLRALVLTNAMKPMMLKRDALADLGARHGAALDLRVSIDHFDPRLHDEERGQGSFAATLAGLSWLVRAGFSPSVAGRTRWDSDLPALRRGYARLFAAHDIAIDAEDPARLVLFPEMDGTAKVPEITTACWGILDLSPDEMMCASSRMVVRRKGAARPSVVACTLIPYDAAFELGATLSGSRNRVFLNHPHCARFCVLGGGSCTSGQA